MIEEKYLTSYAWFNKTGFCIEVITTYQGKAVDMHVVDLSSFQKKNSIFLSDLSNAIYDLVGKNYGFFVLDDKELSFYRCATIEDVAEHIDKALKIDGKKTMAIIESFDDNTSNKEKAEGIFTVIDLVTQYRRKAKRIRRNKNTTNS